MFFDSFNFLHSCSDNGSEVSICFLSVNDKAHKVELSLGKNFYIDSLILSSIKDISGVSKIEEI